MIYIAIIQPNYKEDNYNLVFVDFKNCSATATTFIELKNLGQKVLENEINNLINAGLEIPIPTPIKMITTKNHLLELQYDKSTQSN